MSKSRLEKFLYALYSLDSSDLPEPLSRIEELYKCWVTGEEAPTFEPISRVEKYLMAILGGYDLNELPNPISRVEVLLYKLATGDDNLDDVKSFLSEHEELLAEIIRNGGAGGNIDIEYVLYSLSTEFNTLYNTVEKPVKSAILKGNTLINLFDGEKMALNESSHYTYSNGIIKSAVDGLAWSSKTNLSSAIIPNTKYLLKVKNVGEHNLTVEIRTDLSTLLISQAVSVDQEVIKIITTGGTINGLYVKVYPIETGDGIYAQAKVNIIKYQDGMENWDIPYFEGMKSVQMPVLKTTGNNLFDIKSMIDDERVYEYDEHSMTIKNSVYNISEILGLKHDIGEQYTIIYTRERISGDGDAVFAYRYTDGSITYINPKNPTHSSSTKVLECIELTYGMAGVSKLSNICLSKGIDFGLTYKPYKSNILTVNEDVTLRSNGDVYDELNLLTGELTTRTREVVYDSTDIIVTKYSGKENTFSLTFNDKSKNTRSIMADKIPVVIGWSSFLTSFNLCCSSLSSNYIYVTIPNVNEHEEAKTYLSNLNPTFLYILAEESIKTVDLSVVDQDGNNAELKTFNDITYVTLSSEGLIPEAELKVATKNEEVLSTLSLEMDDISTSQNTLEETANRQSENVDATMIATTEIYEQLL